MNTCIYKINDKKNDIENIERVAQVIRDGGLAAIPTETVYGLAANALNPKAVSEIFKAKGRPQDNPLIVHISELSEIYPLVKEFPEKAKALAEKFWPGPLTVILPKSDIIPNEVSAGLSTVAIRMPSHPIANAIIKAAGVPLAAPSANSSGLPSPTKAEHVIDDMTGKIPVIVDGGESSVGVESTVISLAVNPPRLLRPGGITPEQLESVLGEIEIDSAVTSKLKDGEVAASPGMKYKHYSPKAEVYIIKSCLKSFRCFIDEISEPGDYAICFDGEEKEISIPSFTYGSESSPEVQAQRLFDILRSADKKGAKRVFVRCPSSRGVGLAVYNRLIRAAAFRVIEIPDIYGLTGQTGAGKTTVAAELEKQGFYVIDCDIAARKIVKKGSPVLDELKAEFGDDIILPNGELNRKALAAKAFSSEKNEKILNKITHPAITKLVRKEILENKDKYKLIFVDAAMLFESELYSYCNKTVVVCADEEVRMHRIIQRDSITRDDALLRINAQPDEEYYLSRADVVIKNNSGELNLAGLF